MGSEIIVVEDEALLRELYTGTLAAAGHRVRGAGDAASCRELLRTTCPDLIVLDLGLPDLDGLELAAELRAVGDAGLMVVSRRQTPEDRIAALELGCDDFLVKPVHLGELAARAQAILRRRAGRSVLRFGGLTLDQAARTLSADGRPIDLTRGEFTMIALLARARGAVVDRETLCGPVSRNAEESDLRTVDALIRRIRRKLEQVTDATIIATVPGVGYRLAVTVE